MNRIKSIKTKVFLHPMMAIIVMIFAVIIASGILNFFGASASYNTVNAVTGNNQSNLVTVESLFSLRGLKYIFSNTVSNFSSFAPLIMLLISLIGIGIMDRSGFLDTLFFVFTKKLKKSVVTFFLVLFCLLVSYFTYWYWYS